MKLQKFQSIRYLIEIVFQIILEIFALYATFTVENSCSSKVVLAIYYSLILSFLCLVVLMIIFLKLFF